MNWFMKKMEQKNSWDSPFKAVFGIMESDATALNLKLVLQINKKIYFTNYSKYYVYSRAWFGSIGAHSLKNRPFCMTGAAWARAGPAGAHAAAGGARLPRAHRPAAAPPPPHHHSCQLSTAALLVEHEQLQHAGSGLFHRLSQVWENSAALH